ncbi:uncharacterized protein LOC107646363 [Arachis ipaensis]|uniref:uncharacterized protein LOC107646363 n=1 Tax=Arachis ipaensis TaxID=130454 RepID=UPI0007AFAAF0|nr:uncharacterized protein LOC107646363 [Arachis ipaensis]
MASDESFRLGLLGVKRVEKLFYRIPISVLRNDVKYDSFIINSDEDMQVLFHCRRQFPEVRTPELLAKLVDVASSSGGSNRNMHSTGYVASSSALPVGSSSAVPVLASESDLVASPSFAVNLNRSCDALVGEAGPLEDGDFAARSSPPCVPVIEELVAPEGVEDALQDDDADDVEPATIDADDSKEETPRMTPPVSEGASSSVPQEDPSVPVGFGARDSQNPGGVSEFQVGQQFQDKEEVVLSVKTYSIRRRVEYKVLESDHRKYYGKCKEFGSGADAATSIKVLQNATKAHFGFRPTYRRVWMAKQKAMAQIYGDWDDSYNELPDGAHVTPQPGILVISDRHNGIKAALEAPDGGWLPPTAYRAFCIRHVAANFALTFKGKDARRLLGCVCF